MIRLISLRAGMRWASRRNLLTDLKTAAVLAGLLLCYGIVGRMDYEDEMRTEAAALEYRADLAEKILADCMNGTAKFFYANTTGTGYQKTAVVCQPAQEITL